MKLSSILGKYLQRRRFEMIRRNISMLNDDCKLLEIGCDKDKAFLKTLKIQTFGLDLQLGTKVDKKLNFQNNFFDCIVMIATIEHLEFPNDVIKECNRVLKDRGQLIITTPKNTPFLYIMEHVFFRHNLKIYPNFFIFNKKQLQEITEDYFELKHYETFEYGLNRLFVFEKGINEQDKLGIGNPMEVLY